MMIITLQPVHAESGRLTLYLLDDSRQSVSGTVAVYNLENVQPYFKKNAFSIKKAEKIIKQYDITAQVRTSTNGCVVFNGLKAGTYLVVQQSVSKDYYPFKSFLVKLPNYEKESQSYRYNVTCFPKIEKKKTITETPQLPVYETKEPSGKKKTSQKGSAEVVKKTEKSPTAVKTGDETILSVLVGMMLIAAVTMIAAKMMK